MSTPDSAHVKNSAVHYPEKDTENQITEEIREMHHPQGEIREMRDLPPEETTEIGHVMATRDHVIYAWSLIEVAQAVMVKEGALLLQGPGPVLRRGVKNVHKKGDKTLGKHPPAVGSQHVLLKGKEDLMKWRRKELKMLEGKKAV
jgi:hypothetical protein